MVRHEFLGLLYGIFAIMEDTGGQYRICMACRLLSGGEHRVYEVAEKVGYRDVTYFGSTFKKFTGLSPTEYQDRRE